MRPDLEAMAASVVSLIRDALAPVVADVKALQGLVAAADARWNDLGALRERVATVEAKADLLDPAAAVGRLSDSVADLRDRIVAVETKATAPVTDLLVGELRERVAVLETRAPVPGPAGQDGLDGLAGKDGVDGLGFEDLAVDFDGDRTLALTFTRGTQVKTFPIVLPFLRYQGVFSEGKQYAAGDVVTWGGHAWHCRKPTTTKPDFASASGEQGKDFWTLMVKKGDIGKPGKDGADLRPVPVVSIGVRS